MKHSIKAFKITWENKFGEHSFYEFTEKTALNSLKRFEHFNATMEEETIELFITPAMKKEFQKLIKKIREENFKGEYPKAIMADSMTEKGQASIVFSYSGDNTFRGYTKEMAEKVMSIESFQSFLNKYEATAQIQLRANQSYEIRIQF